MCSGIQCGGCAVISPGLENELWTVNAMGASVQTANAKKQMYSSTVRGASRRRYQGTFLKVGT